MLETKLSLQGLELAPPQVLGGIRLVPLLRTTAREDLRLSRRVYQHDMTVVNVGERTNYIAYIPHGLVANWTTDGGAVFGTQLTTASVKDGETWGTCFTAGGLKRMVRREGKQQLRFLPLHVAMEGFLSLHFGGPDLAWSEYSRQMLRTGLSPRIESAVPGRYLIGLDDALRLFEFHERQCGVLVFVADALASAFVLPTPSDYQALHRTLLTDFYGELLWHYGLHATANHVDVAEIDPQTIQSIDDLPGQVHQLRERWAELTRQMTRGLFDQEYRRQRVYRFKPFTLERFVSDLDPTGENHIGEAIYSDDGDLQYLKTYRLSAVQTRRAYLLSRLAAHRWNLQQLAEAERCQYHEICLRLENAGFGYLLHQHVLDAAHAAQRRNKV